MFMSMYVVNPSWGVRSQCVRGGGGVGVGAWTVCVCAFQGRWLYGVDWDVFICLCSG